MIGLVNRRSQTVAELLIASSVAVVLAIVGLNAFLASRQAYLLGTTREILQQSAGLIMNKIIGGPLEAGAQTGLSEAVSYDWTTSTISDARFTGGTANSPNTFESRFFLDPSGAHIIYQPNFTNDPDLQYVIYTAPAGVTIMLRFWGPHTAPVVQSDSGQYVNNINIDIGVSQQVSGKTVTGSLSTMVNLGNHP